MYFAPFGKKTVVSLESDWPDPSFQGNWLPGERTVGEDGFKATWDIPFLGRNYPQAWLSESGAEAQVAASAFGVTLISPIDAYRMAQRSAKYAVLFIALTLAYCGSSKYWENSASIRFNTSWSARPCACSISWNCRSPSTLDSLRHTCSRVWP